MSTSQDEMVDDLCLQAEECFRGGDIDGARQIFEAVLQIEQEHPRALAGLAQTSLPPVHEPQVAELPAAPSPQPRRQAAKVPAPPVVPADLQSDLFSPLPEPLDTPPPGLMTLELDLSLLPSRPSPSAPARPVEALTGPVPAQGAGEAAGGARSRADAEALNDLLDATSGFVEEPPPPLAAGPTLAAADPAEGEAALLVARARSEFDAGRTEEARRLAARALALSESAPGAQELLDEIRTTADRTEREIHDLLGQAISEVDSGRPDLAIPKLQQVLVLAPDHPEALECLSRAQAACGLEGPARPDVSTMGTPPNAVVPSAPPSAGTSGMMGPDELFKGFTEEDLAPVPIAPRSYTYAVAPRSAERNTGAHPTVPPYASPGAPVAQPAGVPPLPPDPRGASKAPSPETFGPPPPLPPSQQARPAAAPRPAPSAKRPAAPRRTGALAVWLLVAVVVAAGVWFALPFITGGGSGPAERQSGTPASAAAQTKPTAAPQGEAGAAEAPAVTAHVLTAADVPDLVRQAQAALRARNEAEAVRLLETAQELATAPSFELAQQLEEARAALRVRREADAKIAEARARYAEGDFEEALRLLYRIPQGYEPPQLERWIANSWYNVGIQRMQISDLREAREFFSECLKLRPEDESAQRHLEVVRRYTGRTPDDAYRIYVNGLRLRRPNE